MRVEFQVRRRPLHRDDCTALASPFPPGPPLVEREERLEKNPRQRREQLRVVAQALSPRVLMQC